MRAGLPDTFSLWRDGRMLCSGGWSAVEEALAKVFADTDLPHCQIVLTVPAGQREPPEPRRGWLTDTGT